MKQETNAPTWKWENFKEPFYREVNNNKPKWLETGVAQRGCRRGSSHWHRRAAECAAWAGCGVQSFDVLP